MAGVTSSASAVDVGPITLMSLGHVGLWMARAIRAGEGCIVRRVRMASRADAVCAVVIHVPEIVSKCRPQPTCCGVASRASGCDDSDGGRVSGDVVRYRPSQRCGALPLRCVAAIAVGRRLSGGDMAKVTGHSGVRASQWKTGCAVVKNRSQPRGRCVARRTCRRITGTDVVRNRAPEGRCALPSSSMATVAIGG